ncbi:alpha/beta hydrolase [Myxococcota bacterium]|nr:alpha/beta hydrolase [Myxococcota bacterium]
MLDEVQRRKISISTGVEVALLDWGGEGPLALLHHANGFCAALWDLVATRLVPHFRVVALDARGHGDSSKPSEVGAYAWPRFCEDLIATAEFLLEEGPHGSIGLGIGHSFGGAATLTAAAKRPELFDQIALIDPIIFPPAGFQEDGPRTERGNFMAEGARRRRQKWPSRADARANWSEKELFADWLPRALDLYVAEGLADCAGGGVELKCAGEVEAAIFEGGRGSEAWEATERLRVPVLLMWANRGQFPREVFEMFASRMSGSIFHELHAGHLAPMERPDLVVEALLEFAAAVPLD